MYKIFLIIMAFILFISSFISGLLSIKTDLVVDTRHRGLLQHYEMTETVVVDNTLEHELTDELNVYVGDKGEVIPYVDLNDFFNFISPAILSKPQLEIEFNDHLWKATANHQQLILNFETKQLIIDDLLLLEDLASVNTSSRKNDLGYKEQTMQTSKRKIIDLSDYQIHIDYQNGYYLVPFYLANFLLSGYGLEVVHYFNNFGHYIFVETPGNFLNRQVSPFFSQMKVMLQPDDLSQLQKETMSFLQFIFDHFYGLGKMKDIDYSRLHQGDEPQTIKEYQTRINEFIYGIDDLHTSIIYQSHLNRNFNALDYQKSQYYFNYYRQYQTAQCNGARRMLVDDYLIDNQLYIEIFSFEDGLEDALNKIMDKYPPDSIKAVYFDVRCNAGGYISQIQFLMRYMTDQPWSLTNNDINGGIREWTFKTDTRFYLPDTEFFVVSSGYTYSSANTFVALVKDLNLATIIGEKTYGGVAAIDVLSLPDGSVIGLSSPFRIFTLKNNQDLENGIEPNVKIDFLALANLNSGEIDTSGYDQQLNSNILYYREQIFPHDYRVYREFIERIINYQKGVIK